MKQKAFKYRLYPTEAQKEFFAQHFGASRFIYNHFLGKQKEAYEAFKAGKTEKPKSLSHFDIGKQITLLKKEEDYGWLKDMDSNALNYAAEDLANAYKHFFRRNSAKKGDPGFPNFKNRFARQSYRTKTQSNARNVIGVFENAIRLPKCKELIPAVIHRPLPENVVIKQAIISKDSDHRYYASIMFDYETDEALPATGKEIGLDAGIKSALTTSDGETYEAVFARLQKAEAVLKKEQRKLARKTKKSNNFSKQKAKVAKAFSKVTRIKQDYYHNISRQIVNDNDAICLESLNIEGMRRNKKISSRFQAASLGELLRMISYKSEWAGREIRKVDTFFPSSKQCFECGEKNNDLKLSDRFWTCKSCGAKVDRDINAAKNILKYAEKELAK